MGYRLAANGELAGSVAALQMPNQVGTFVRFKAHADNAGKVYIGGPGVTIKNNATDVTTGLQLSAGDDTGWIPCSNLNEYFRICDNVGDGLTYMMVAG